MCITDELKNKPFVIIDFTLLFAIGIIHFIFFFFINKTDFENIFDVFESSPLFGFYLSQGSCGADDHLIFHVFEGIQHSHSTYSSGRSSSSYKSISGRADIDKINGNLFCYQYKSYKDLLYNGQIIKNGENCPNNFPKNCGIIDTLKQKLCIKENEKCPLYDVGIGQPPNEYEYEYNEGNSDIYYNNENYNRDDKKIIGKLILNDGQPCYRISEQLWRKFDSNEVGDQKLECTLEVFGVTTDNRYERKGDIEYKKLYEFLSGDSKTVIMDDIKDEYVSLYQREFLGIDKTCDEETEINKSNYEKLRKNQKMEKVCVIVEGLIIICVCIPVLIIIMCIFQESYVRDGTYEYLNFILFIMILLNLTCIICQSVFLGRIIKYDLSYDCSDEITNEVLRLENENTKKSITYTSVNLGLDVFYILFNSFTLLFFKTKKEIADCFSNLKYPNQKKKEDKTSNISYTNKPNEINKEPQREVIVNNATPEVNNNPLENNNNINININYNNNNFNNNNYNKNPYSDFDLGVPPSLEQGYNSNANI